MYRLHGLKDSSKGGFRKVIEQKTGATVYVPMAQLKITGKPTNRQERRLIELRLRRERKKAARAAARE
jgi:hypothetical protein